MQGIIQGRKSSDRHRIGNSSSSDDPEVGMILDEDLLREIIADRQAIGADLRDEVWDGVYMIMPLPNNEHQEIAFELGFAFRSVLGPEGRVRMGVNVSNQRDDWTKNYRDPDVVVFLPGTTAENRDTYWLGGPDFAVEVVSKGDASREKLDFYGRVNVRELLLIDCYPWSLELYRNVDGVMELLGRSTIEDQIALRSAVLPLCFRLLTGPTRPIIEVAESGGDRRWSV